MVHGWRALVALIVLLALAELAGVQSLGDRVAGMRPPNRSELFFSYMAQKLNAPSLCRKIPWTAQAGPGIDFAAEYVRSDCYEAIAGNTGNPWLCWEVKRLGAVSVWRHQTSMWSCVQRARRHEQSGSAVSPEELALFFKQMGYAPDTLQAEGVTPALVQVRSIYLGLTDRAGLKVRSGSEGGDVPVMTAGAMDQAMLLRRIEDWIGPLGSAMPGKHGMDAADRAYMADMAAMMTRDWRWCMKIPADLALTQERAGFRNWCLLKVATETRDGTVCDRIAEEQGSAPLSSLTETCRFQAGSKLPAVTHYAPEVPGDNVRTRRLLGMLQVAVPRAMDLPEEQIYQAYIQFLYELDGRKKDAAHVVARQRLIARVEALPAQ